MANPIVAFFNWAKGYAAEAWIALKMLKPLPKYL